MGSHRVGHEWSDLAAAAAAAAAGILPSKPPFPGIAFLNILAQTVKSPCDRIFVTWALPHSDLGPWLAVVYGVCHHVEECFILRNHLVSIPSWSLAKPGLEPMRPDSLMGILSTQVRGRQAHLNCSVWRGSPDSRDPHAFLCGSQELACSHTVEAPRVWPRMQPFHMLTKWQSDWAGQAATLPDSVIQFLFLKKSAACLSLKESSFLEALWGHQFEMQAGVGRRPAWKSCPWVTGSSHNTASSKRCPVGRQDAQIPVQASPGSKKGLKLDDF